jgi:chromosome segregation ATPase
MDIHETIAQIKSQLARIEHHETENQQEQSQVTELIVNLEKELKQWHRRRDELD